MTGIVQAGTQSLFRFTTIFSIFLAALFCIYRYPVVSRADASWYSSNWTYREPITVSATQVSGANNLNNFTLLFKQTNAALKIVSNGGNVVQDDGGDIVFTASDGLTKLSHEIEKYDPATGELVAWVKIPTLNTTSDTILYIYYGNTVDTGNQSTPTDVWTSYNAVWHVADDPSSTADGECGGSTTELCDSTSNNNDVDAYNMESADSISGMVGNALNFDLGEYVDINDANSLDMGTGDFTISMWAKYPSQVGGAHNYAMLFGKNLPTDPYTGIHVFAIDRDIASTGSDGLLFRVNNANGVVSTTGSLDNDTWKYYTFVRTGTTLNLYINGQIDNSASIASVDVTNIVQLRMGGNPQDPSVQSFAGNLDEIRISGSALSSDWIATEYNNQYSSNTFYSIGAQETEVVYGLTLTQSGGSTVVTEGGNTDTYTVALSAQPTSDVTIAVNSSNIVTGVTVSPTSLTFTTSNWNQTQTVTVTAVDDNSDEGATHQVTVAHAVSSSDANYNSLSSDLAVTVNNNDDFTGPVISSLTPSANSSTSVTISWSTDEAASTQVEYGYTDVYGTITSEADLSPRVTSHSVALTNLSKCSTYHFRVKSTDAQGNQTTSSDSNFFTTGCEDLYPTMDASCDNTNPNNYIHIRNDADVTTVRNAVINYIWSGDGLPSRQPDLITQNIGTMPYVSSGDMTNLARIDQIDITLDEGFTARAYHFIPTIDNNRLFIVHQGHSDLFTVGEVDQTVKFLVDKGYAVISFHMPESGPNTGPVAGTNATAHNNMTALESASFNPMELFVEPIYVALNYIDNTYDYQDINMVGLSGGGWTTTLYPAIDTRVKISFPVAGSYPIHLRGAPCGPGGNDSGDYEQGTAGKPLFFYANVASYLDLYILSSAGTGRKQIQIINEFDDCCFAAPRYHIYESTIANEVASLSGGRFDVQLDSSHATHKISTYTKTNYILPELVQSVSPTAGGGGTAVAEVTAPNDTYSLVLPGEPIADVTISISSSNTSTGVTVSPSTLTFTRANWNTPQTVTVSAVADSQVEGNHSTTISHTTSSTDPQYDGITIANVAVSITEDTTAPGISSISNTPSTLNGVVTWSTNELGSSRVEYGLTNSYGNTTAEINTSPRVLSHQVTLSGLHACTTYHYRVKTKDSSLNESIGSDNAFTTTGCTGSAAIQASTASTITNESGGNIELLDSGTGMALTVPANFTSTDANFQIKRLEKTATLATTSTPTSATLLGNYVYDLKALTGIDTTISSFDASIAITITYADEEVAGLDEEGLQIHRWDGSSWFELTGCSVDTEANTATCTTSQFSIFGLFGQPPSSSTTSSSPTPTPSQQTASCTSQAPGSQGSWLYGAIAQDENSILLYFTASEGPVNKYVLAYGTKAGEYVYGVPDMTGTPNERMTYLVKELKPGTEYYFKIRSDNGCKTGPWSNEIKATTRKRFEVKNINLDTTSIEVKQEEKTDKECKTYTIKSGDNLWNIARDVLHDGSMFIKIIEENSEAYPSLKSSNNVRVGWSLKIRCKNEGTQKAQETIPEKVNVNVKVTKDNQPVKGVEVTFHSDPIRAMTDENGIAHFPDVAPGQHRVVVAYQGYSGEQTIYLTATESAKEFDINITIKPENKIIKILTITISCLALACILLSWKLKSSTGYSRG